MTKADKLRAIAEEAARELECASVGRALSYDEFVAVLGEGWLNWLPSDEGITLTQLYARFTRSLVSYRKNDDPAWAWYE